MTKGAKKRTLLVLGGALWTIAAGAAGGAILLRAPLILEVGGAPLFVSSPGIVVLVWALGAGVLLASLVRTRWLSRALWAISCLALLASLVWTAGRLATWPEIETSAADEASVGGGRTTLLIAVDGMSWTAILPMARRGELPNISRLMDEGSYGVLHSLRTYRKKVDKWGYWSPVVWTSVATGVRPRRHGITDFVLEGGPARGGIAASTQRTAPAFWNLLSAFGKKVAVVGWWATWPAEPISGYMVSSHVGIRGWRTDERGREGLTYPEELADQLELRGGDPESIKEWASRELFPFEVYPVLPGDKLETAYAALWQDRLYFESTRTLIKTREPLDLYAVYFEGIDVLSHYLWGAYQDPGRPAPVSLPQGFRDHARVVPAYYRVIDSYLGDLLETLPEETTVLIVSDHGFQLDPDNFYGAGHSPYGVLIARGEGIARGRKINLDPLGSVREALHQKTNVLDVLPTLLYLHGFPVAHDLDGRILQSLFTRRFLEEQPVLWVDSYGDFRQRRAVEVRVDPETSATYQKRLRALGYLQ